MENRGHFYLALTAEHAQNLTSEQAALLGVLASLNDSGKRFLLGYGQQLAKRFAKNERSSHLSLVVGGAA